MQSVNYVISGVVFAFNVGVNNVVNQMHHKVPIKQHKVIYKLFDDLLETLNSRLPPLEVEDRIGLFKSLTLTADNLWGLR